MRDAARWRLKFLNEEAEYVQIPKKKCERLETAVKEMNTPYYGLSDFIHKHIEEMLEQYDKWLEGEREKRQRKRS